MTSESHTGTFSPERQTSEKEAAFLGLPTLEQINQKIELLGSGLEIIPHKNDNDGILHFEGRVEPVEISPEQYEQYQKEFKDEVDDFRLRMQRLKIRTYGMYLSGSLRGAGTPADESYSREDNTPLRKFLSLLFEMKEKDELNEKDRKKLVQEYNKWLPHNCKLEVLDNMTKWDAMLLKELHSDLTYGKLLLDKEIEHIEALLSEITEIENVLDDIQDQGELFVKDGTKFIGEEKYHQLWDRYRILLKRLATYEEEAHWFSPTYGSSGKGQKGKGQFPEAMRTDYQRFRMKEGEEVENRLGAAMFGVRKYGHAKHMIFNGGMNALEAIMLVVDQEIGERRHYEGKLSTGVYKTKDIYFEVDSQIEQHFGAHDNKPKELDPTDTDEIIRVIKQEKPAAVFLNPMSNMYEMQVTEVRKILESLIEDEDWKMEGHREKGMQFRDVYIVIDNTTLGKLAKWKDLNFNRLPKFVRVISFESLVKYGEDGQDITQGALVTTLGEYADEQIDRLRCSGGFMPSETTFRRLEASIPQDLTDKKMARHTRNSELIGRALEESVEQTQDSFISEVVFPGLESHQQHEIVQQEMLGAGGLFSLGFNFEQLRNYQERHYYRQDIHNFWDEKPLSKHGFKTKMKELVETFNDLVIEMAKQAGVEINKGTSYGFNTTRISIYERIIPGAKDYYDRKNPYVRFSVGTENIKDALIISEIVQRANEIFVQAIRQHRLFDLVDKLVGHQKGTIEFDV